MKLDAKPASIAIDTEITAILVIDMQNDFGAKGGMLDRAGIDISIIQRAVQPTARVVAAGREAGLKVIYLKMAFKHDLSDAGPKNSRNRAIAAWRRNGGSSSERCGESNSYPRHMEYRYSSRVDA